MPLAKDHIAFNVFRYITFRAAMATVTALVICFVVGPWLIRRLRELQHGGDTIREDTPARHRAKAGTPTMGGLVILAAVLVSTLLWANLANRYVWTVILATAGLGLIGFLDDWKKLRTRKGISAQAEVRRADPLGGRCSPPRSTSGRRTASRPGWPSPSSRAGC